MLVAVLTKPLVVTFQGIYRIHQGSGRFKFGDGDEPNLCRENKEDFSSTFY